MCSWALVCDWKLPVSPVLYLQICVYKLGMNGNTSGIASNNEDAEVVSNNTPVFDNAELFALMKHLNENPGDKALKSQLIKSLTHLHGFIGTFEDRGNLVFIIEQLKSVPSKNHTRIKLFIKTYGEYIMKLTPVPSWTLPGHTKGGYRKTRRFVRRTGKSRKQKRKTQNKF